MVKAVNTAYKDWRGAWTVGEIKWIEKRYEKKFWFVFEKKHQLQTKKISFNAISSGASINQRSHQFVEFSVHRFVSESFDQSANQSVSQPTDQPVSESFDQSVSEFVNQHLDQSASQFHDQPASFLLVCTTSAINSYNRDFSSVKRARLNQFAQQIFFYDRIFSLTK